MVNYKIDTRRRVLEFIRSRRKPIAQKNLQYLGEQFKQVNFNTLKSVLDDLEKEKLITIERHEVGTRTIHLIEAKR